MAQAIRLRGLNGATEGIVWEFEMIVKIGRLAGSAVVLEDKSVSRRHAEIRPCPDGWCVCDLGSSGGTRLNGSRLQPGEWPLRAGDILGIGNVKIQVRSIGDGAPAGTE